MTRVHSTALCASFFLAFVGASFAQHVQTDFDHQANFSQYKTYSWQGISHQIPAGTPESRTPWMHNWQPRAGLK